MPRTTFLSVLIIVCVTCPLAGQYSATFDTDAEGWIFDAGEPGGMGSALAETTGGNPGGNLRIMAQFVTAGITSTDATYLVDLTAFDTATLAHDFKAEVLDVSGAAGFRPWQLYLIDYDDVPAGSAFAGVLYSFGIVSVANQGDWTTFQAVIDDTKAIDPPAGWVGLGSDDGMGQDTLPPGRTFASVLAGYDQIFLSTHFPSVAGGQQPQGDFDYRIDNISLIVPPPPFFANGFESGDTTGWSSTSP